MVVSADVGAGNRAWVLCKSIKSFGPRNHPSSLPCSSRRLSLKHEPARHVWRSSVCDEEGALAFLLYRVPSESFKRFFMGISSLQRGQLGV